MLTFDIDYKFRYNPERRYVGKSEFPPNQQKVVYFTLGLGKESLLEG